MKREIIVTPAFDKRDPNPAKNCGIHGADMHFVLTGDNGAITFTLYTNWHLPHVAKEQRDKCRNKPQYDFMFQPYGADISYHSYIPRYAGHTDSGPCNYLDGKPCYCDGSGLSARPICDMLIAEGSEAVWKELERWYNEKLT